MLTNGKEQRQFLYADDCSDCLLKLSQEYNNISRDQELHITHFKWHTILDVAKIIASIYPGTIIQPAQSIDEVQKDRRNEPNTYILKYWQPKTELIEGIRLIDSLMRA